MRQLSSNTEMIVKFTLTEPFIGRPSGDLNFEFTLTYCRHHHSRNSASVSGDRKVAGSIPFENSSYRSWFGKRYGTTWEAEEGRGDLLALTPNEPGATSTTEFSC